MQGTGRRGRWAALAVLALMLVVGLTVGFAAYNAGVSHGVAIAAHAADVERAVQPGAQAAPVPMHGYYGYGWHPWGFGFGFFMPFLFILFWFVVLKAIFFRAFWGGPWHGRWRGYGYRHGYRYGGCHPYGGRMRDEPPVHM